MKENSKTIVMHVAALEALLLGLLIYLNKKVKITSLLIKKIIILYKYFNFIDVFLKKKALILLEQINFNKYTIELESNK